MMSMWESMGGAGLGLSGATGKPGLQGGRPHLLELVHSLLQLDPHCVLLFPPDRHVEGGENRPGVPPATLAPAPLRPPLGPDQTPGLAPWMGIHGDENTWAASQWAAAAAGWLHTSWQGVSSPTVWPDPLDRVPGTIFKNNCHHFGPLQYPSPRGPSSASCLAGLIPPPPAHTSLPRPPPQPSLPPSVAQIRSPAPARTEQSLLACCPASWVPLKPGKASAGHRRDQELPSSLAGDKVFPHPAP